MKDKFYVGQKVRILNVQLNEWGFFGDMRYFEGKIGVIESIIFPGESPAFSLLVDDSDTGCYWSKNCLSPIDLQYQGMAQISKEDILKLLVSE